jgi:hypothetical protein
LRARWWIRSIYCFDSINKRQVTQERLYSEQRKRRALGTMEEVVGQQRSTEKSSKQFQVSLSWRERIS